MNNAPAPKRYRSSTQLRSAGTIAERIHDILNDGATPVLVEDDDPKTLAMARALGAETPYAGAVFAMADGPVGDFAREMVETACLLGSGKAGYVSLFDGHADVG